MFAKMRRNPWKQTIRSVSGVRRKFSWGGFIQWHLVVICIWCALFDKIKAIVSDKANYRGAQSYPLTTTGAN